MDAYDELLAMLDRPAADHWDRPHGDWGTTDHGGEAALTEARQAANSGYRLGSKALRRGDVSRAVKWFALGAEEQHPGAAFRWAAAEARRGFVVHHAAGSGKSMALVLMVRLMARASSWGHGDAERLVNRIRWHEDGATETPDGAAYPPRTLGHANAIGCEGISDDLLGRLTLVADEEPYSPQDPEFYPEVREAFERLPSGSDTFRGLGGDEHTA